VRKLLINFSAICFALLFAGIAMGQTQPTATIKNLGDNTIIVDGLGNGVWASIEPISIERIFRIETPSLTASWKAVWNSEGIYVLVEVTDDVWLPSWMSGFQVWESDQVELYFDVSSPQQDGGGPVFAEQAAAGNWQIAPNFIETSGKDTTESNGTIHATTFDGNGIYSKEFFVPFSTIQKDGEIINPAVMNVIGFDVTIIDNDGEGRNRQVWSNDGIIGEAPNESWNNCDMVGLITLSPSVVDYIPMETNFLTYTIPNQVSSSINELDQTVSVTMPYQTDLTALVPTYTVTPGAATFIGAEQVSSTLAEVDFTNPVTYTIRNGYDTQDWVVTVIAEEPVTLTFNLDVSAQAINEGDINLFDDDVFYVTGSFNDWAEPGAEGSILLTKGENNSWTGSIIVAKNSSIEYKYYLNTDDASEDYTLAIAELDTTVNDIWTAAIRVDVNTELLSSVSIYPNPVNNQLSLENLEGVSKVKVSNVIGQTLITENVSAAKMHINTTKFNTSIYIVTLVSENGLTRSQKITKQ
jgi:hypothetical protein